MRVRMTLVMFMCMFLAFSQQPKAYFDFQIAKHLESYKAQSEVAIQNDDRQHAEFLFDSLFNTHLKLSYISDMTLKKISGGTVNTSEIDNSFLLITKSAWEQIDDKEIEAINRMAKMYKGQIDIVVLFWTSRMIAKQRGRGFSSHVDVTYVDERENNANHIIAPFKHSFGAPACFFISEDKQLLKIDRKFTANLNTDDSKLSFESAHQQIKQILFNDKQTSEEILTTIN